MLDLQSVLEVATQNAASDIHLKVGLPPLFRVDGNLVPARSAPRIAGTDLAQILDQLTTEAQRERFNETRELDFGYSAPGLGRFRINVFFQRGNLGMVLRLIPAEAKSIQQLFLPPVLSQLCMESRGLVLVTGATGSGKTTTLAAMIQHINNNKSCHIITIEDPIEYVFRDKRSIIDQRELGRDTLSFPQAIRAALRQDPDVILIGELRDQETIETAILASSTGHLVFGTLHTSDAPETLNRILSAFPPHQHQQIRVALASTLRSVISQRLVRRADNNGRVPAVEIMLATARVRELLLDPEGFGQLRETIAQGHTNYNMQTFDQSLMQLLSNGLITKEEALNNCTNRDDFLLRLKGVQGAANSPWDQFE